MSSCPQAIVAACMKNSFLANDLAHIRWLSLTMPGQTRKSPFLHPGWGFCKRLVGLDFGQNRAGPASWFGWKSGLLQCSRGFFAIVCLDRSSPPKPVGLVDLDSSRKLLIPGRNPNQLRTDRTTSGCIGVRAF